MKSGIYKTFGFVFLLTVLLCGNAFAQNSAPETTAKEFYKWYITEIAANREPRKNKTKFAKYVSKRLNKWMNSKAYEEYGADYIIDAQDFNAAWANGISTTKAVIKGNTAVFKVSFKPPPGSVEGDWNYSVRVKFVKEDGVWKIDSVNNRALLS